MRWELEWGSRGKEMAVMAKHLGVETSFQKKPVLPERLQGYLLAFSMLIQSRPVTQVGVGAIPFSEVKAYLDLFQITDWDECECWIKMLRALDDEYLRATNKQREQAQETQNKRR